jgi:hypothetical protein
VVPSLLNPSNSSTWWPGATIRELILLSSRGSENPRIFLKLRENGEELKEPNRPL